MWRIRGRGEVCTGFWWGNLRERNHWGDPDVDERIILRWILRKWDAGHALDSSISGQGQVVGCCKGGKEP
jgi:hypothetical protein